jgi:hypothetical protein
VRFSQILWMVLSEAGGSDVKLAYSAAGNIITISTQEDLDGDMILKVYDVADLILRIPNFRSARIDPAAALQPGNSGAGSSIIPTTGPEPEPGADGADEPGIQALLRLIQDTVEPDSWHDNGGNGHIQAYGTLLVVRNSPRVHSLLGGYLRTAD